MAVQNGALSDRSEFDIGDPDWEGIEELEEYNHLADLLGNVLQDDEEDVQPDFARFIGESTGDSDRFQRRVTSSFTRRWSTFLSFKSLIKHRISFFCFILNLFCESLCRKQTGTEPNKWGRKVFPRDHLSGTDMKWVQKKTCICQTYNNNNNNNRTLFRALSPKSSRRWQIKALTKKKKRHAMPFIQTNKKPTNEIEHK